MKTPRLALAAFLAAVPLTSRAAGSGDAAAGIKEETVHQQAQAAQDALQYSTRYFLARLAGKSGGGAHDLYLRFDVARAPVAPLKRTSQIQPADPDFPEPSLVCAETLEYDLGTVSVAAAKDAGKPTPLRLSVNRTVAKPVGASCQDIDLSGALTTYFVEDRGTFDTLLEIADLEFDGLEIMVLPNGGRIGTGLDAKVGASLTRSGDSYALRGFDIGDYLKKAASSHDAAAHLAWRGGLAEEFSEAPLVEVSGDAVPGAQQ